MDTCHILHAANPRSGSLGKAVTFSSQPAHSPLIPAGILGTYFEYRVGHSARTRGGAAPRAAPAGDRDIFASADRFTATVTSPHPHQWVLALFGDLDIVSASRAWVFIDALLYPGALLVLNLTDLDFIDSSGLRVLLRTQRQAAEVGASVCLAAPGRGLRHLFDLTGTTGQFDIRSDVPAALGTAPADRRQKPPATG